MVLHRFAIGSLDHVLLVILHFHRCLQLYCSALPQTPIPIAPASGLELGFPGVGNRLCRRSSLMYGD